MWLPTADPGFAKGEWDHGERVEREPITGAWGRSPQQPWSRGRAPGGDQGSKPPEAERFWTTFIRRRGPKVKDLNDSSLLCRGRLLRAATTSPLGPIVQYYWDIFWSSLEKMSTKLKIGGDDLKTILNNILKVPVFPPCAFAYMTS